MNPVMLNPGVSSGKSLSPNHSPLAGPGSLSALPVLPSADTLQFSGAAKKPGLRKKLAAILLALAAPLLVTGCGETSTGNNSGVISDAYDSSSTQLQQQGDQHSKTIAEMIAENGGSVPAPGTAPVAPAPDGLTNEQVAENIIRQQQGLDALNNMPDGNPETVRDPLTNSEVLDPAKDPWNPASDVNDPWNPGSDVNDPWNPGSDKYWEQDDW